jgi:AraC-like DNA-binding protein
MTPSMISIRVLLGPRALAHTLAIESDFLEAIGLDAALWADLDSWVPLRASRIAFDWLEARTGDAAVGFRAADCVPQVAFDYLQFIGATSSDLRAAMKSLELFLPMLNTEARATLIEMDRVLRFGISAGPLEEVGARASEYVVACALRGFQAISSRPLRPLRVDFRHRAPCEVLAYERFFGCPVSFDSGEDALVFPAAAGEYPTTNPNTQLQAVLIRLATELDRRRPRTGTLKHQVEQIVFQQLGKTEVSIDACARWLGISGRTLQRRLEQEGTPFRELVEGVRERLARSLLRTPGVSIRETAARLGYADARSFHRAFTAWTGVTPGRFSRLPADRKRRQ